MVIKLLRELVKIRINKNNMGKYRFAIDCDFKVIFVEIICKSYCYVFVILF